MSPEEGVRDLVLRHADYINLGQEDNFAGNFAPDGVWDVVGYSKAEGREQVRAIITELRGLFEWVYQAVNGTRILSLTEDTAFARSYIVEYGRTPGKPYFLFASYHGHCVLIDGTWYFKHRRAEPLYLGSAALDAPVKAFPATDYFADHTF